MVVPPSHWTPCQASPHGSPPEATHPGRTGDSNATYKLRSAATKPCNKIPDEKCKHHLYERSNNKQMDIASIIYAFLH